MSNRVPSTNDSGLRQLFLRQLKSSSGLTFARSLFHAAEGKELFDDEFVFASAVSAYYSLFHLGAALMLAHFSQPAPAEFAYASTWRKLERKWRNPDRILRPQPVRNECNSPSHPFPDPAKGIGHEDVATFLEREIPGVFRSLGRPEKLGTLRDMREFVNYAPRMVSDGCQIILYSYCQYKAQDFKRHVKEHLDQLDGFFHTAVRWIKEKSYNALYSRILSGDFVLLEFADLGSYHPDRVAKRAWAIYRSICEHEGADWRIWRGEPGTWYMGEREERERYAEAVRRFES
jgi:hypothetical protein